MTQLVESFNDRFQFRFGTDYRQIRAVEALLGVNMPAALIELLLLANGQSRHLRDGSPSDMFFPELDLSTKGIDGFSGIGYLCGIEEILLETLLLRDEYRRIENDGIAWKEFVESFETRGPVVVNKSFIVLSHGPDAALICMDLLPASGGAVGQIVAISEQPERATVLFPTLSEFLNNLLEGYLAQRYLYLVDLKGWTQRM